MICDVVSMKVEIWTVVSIHHVLPPGTYNPNIVLRDKGQGGRFIQLQLNLLHFCFLVCPRLNEVPKEGN